MTLVAPTSIRETLDFLRFYRPEVGLGPLFDGAQGEQWNPRQIYLAVHGRPPDSLATVLNTDENRLYDIFEAALFSDEFREKHIVSILRAYAEKQRVFFVHIPKSAGSDLASNLTSRFPTLNTRLSQIGWASHEEFLLSLKHFALEAAQSDTIFVTGHNHLATYEGWNLLRYNDRIFSVLRDPMDQVISQLNYVVTRIFSDEIPIAPDTAGWRHEFGIDGTQPAPTGAALLDLAHRVLHHPGVVPENVACAYLGIGTCQSAIERIAIHNVEMVELSTYEAWCQAEWGIEQSRRVNESKKYLRASDLSPADMDYALSITREDRLLHDCVTAALRTTGTHSITGSALAKASPPPGKPQDDAPMQAEDQPVADKPDLAPNELMLKFESLGENCEFGLVQRRCGAEPLGLLRFASAPLPKLLKALNNRFEGMGRPENIEVQVSGNGREYMVLDKAYGFLYHAWVLVGEQSVEEVHARECRRVPFLIRKLIEDLEDGSKIFVYHPMDRNAVLGIKDLTTAIRKYGNSALLWVQLADSKNPIGTIVTQHNSSLIGYIDRFAPGENAHDLSLHVWTSLCAKAWSTVFQKMEI